VNSSQATLTLVFGVLVLIWFGMSLYVLISRFIHDLGRAAIDRAEIEVERRHRDGSAYGSSDLGSLIRRLPRRKLGTVAADTATPEPLAAALSADMVDRWPAQLLADAESAQGRSRWKRVVALRILVRVRSSEASSLLERALQSEDEAVVGVAVNALGELGDDHSSMLLIRALRSGRFPRSRIATRLDQAPGCSTELLVPLLVDSEPAVRFWGATLLGRRAADGDIAYELVAIADDPDPSVRAAVAEGLAGSDAPEACAAVRRLVGDPVWFVRVHAVRALGSFDRDDVVADAAPLLADESWWVRTAAKETLESRPRAAAEILDGYLAHPDRFARNGAAEVLQNIGVLDELVANAPLDPVDSELLESILRAGGAGLAAAALARSGASQSDLDDLVASS
jgi:HEAT repeat protein